LKAEKRVTLLMLGVQGFKGMGQGAERKEQPPSLTSYGEPSSAERIGQRGKRKEEREEGFKGSRAKCIAQSEIRSQLIAHSSQLTGYWLLLIS
jgi:hypothetical protein